MAMKRKHFAKTLLTFSILLILGTTANAQEKTTVKFSSNQDGVQSTVVSKLKVLDTIPPKVERLALEQAKTGLREIPKSTNLANSKKQIKLPKTPVLPVDLSNQRLDYSKVRPEKVQSATDTSQNRQAALPFDFSMKFSKPEFLPVVQASKETTTEASKASAPVSVAKTASHSLQNDDLVPIVTPQQVSPDTKQRFKVEVNPAKSQATPKLAIRPVVDSSLEKQTTEATSPKRTPAEASKSPAKKPTQQSETKSQTSFTRTAAKPEMTSRRTRLRKLTPLRRRENVAVLDKFDSRGAGFQTNNESSQDNAAPKAQEPKSKKELEEEKKYAEFLQEIYQRIDKGANQVEISKFYQYTQRITEGESEDPEQRQKELDRKRELLRTAADSKKLMHYDAGQYLASNYRVSYNQLGAAQYWAPKQYLWHSTGFYHRPLYFEQKNLERYGNDFGALSNLVSAAHFFGTIAILPYKMGAYPQSEPMYTLGHGRPGNCVSQHFYSLPRSARGAALQALTTVGAVIALP